MKKVYLLNWETLVIHEVFEPEYSVDNQTVFSSLSEANKMRDYLDTDLKLND